MTAPDRWHDPSSWRPTRGLEGDQLVLVSSGIDIGSSTMHLVVSRLIAERDAGGFDIVAREVAYESPIELTPYLQAEEMDATEVARRFRHHYEQAGLTPEQVDTGVVILTGVALNRSNARALGEVVAAWGGHFLSVAAGDRLEGVLAGHGSGAVERSQDGQVVLNVDIGGGTTKFARCEQGRVTAVGAFDIGTRLVAWATDRAVTRLEPSGRLLLERLGLPAVEIGDRFDAEQEWCLADRLAAGLTSAVNGSDAGLLTATSRTGSHVDLLAGIDEIVLSGGFTEYLAGRTEEDFGDLGALLSARVRTHLIDSGSATVAAPGIRATALGAGQFTVQVSGITIHRAAELALPVCNVPVVRVPRPPAGEVHVGPIASDLERGLELLEIGHGPVAVSIPWQGSATVARLSAVAEGIALGLERRSLGRSPLVVLTDGDVARLLGRHIQRRLGEARAIAVVDGIVAEELDFVDVGAPVGAYDAIPITIKSLAFPASGDAPSTLDGPE